MPMTVQDFFFKGEAGRAAGAAASGSETARALAAAYGAAFKVAMSTTKRYLTSLLSMRS
jgi:hypothetical protein